MNEELSVGRKFKVGDAVRLAGSGSPVMTVNRVYESASQIECVWFVGGKLERALLDDRSVVPYEKWKGGVMK